VRGFGDLESTVMDVMWQRAEPSTVREILDQLTASRSLAYTTVMTVLDNLHRKGMLARVKAGRAWVYEPIYGRGEYTARVMRDVLSSVDDRATTLAHFVDAMSEDESQTLRGLLRRRPGRRT
jgi:predicted transcriptional regulator